MYNCEKCGAKFKEPKIITEIHYELFEKAKEYFIECPLCGCSRIERKDKND